MDLNYFLVVFLLTHLSFATPHTINIINAWSLPQDGSNYFFRYFQDRITWKEAFETCKKYRSELLTGETDEQRDASKTYLNKLDTPNQVWIGLQRIPPQDPSIYWINGKRLVGEGNFLEPPLNATVCFSMDPAADFRWKSFGCDGPQQNAFVCQMKVPEWAGKRCFLPSVNVMYLPDDEIIELISDCGPAGTKRATCKEGQTNDYDLTKRLSCEDDDTSTERNPTTQITRATRHKRDKTPVNITGMFLATTNPTFTADNPTTKTTSKSAENTSVSTTRPKTTPQPSMDTQLEEIKTMGDFIHVEFPKGNTTDNKSEPAKNVQTVIKPLVQQTQTTSVQTLIETPKEENADFAEDVDEQPQRPTRGRVISHSSPLSFYPYFLNRVLG